MLSGLAVGLLMVLFTAPAQAQVTNLSQQAASREVQIISDEQQVRNQEDELRRLLNSRKS